jgi:hypothetical protein
MSFVNSDNYFGQESLFERIINVTGEKCLVFFAFWEFYGKRCADIFLAAEPNSTI